MEPSQIVLNAMLTQFIAGVRPASLIGRRIAPLVPCYAVAGLTTHYWSVRAADVLRRNPTKVGRMGRVNISDLGFDKTPVVLDDHGQRCQHPNDLMRLNQAQPAQILQAPMNVRMAKVKNVVNKIWFEHEFEVRDLVFTLTNYDATLRRAAGAGDMFDDPDTNPITVINEMLDSPLMRPNVLVTGLEVFRALQVHKTLVSAIKGLVGEAQVQGGQVTAEQIAQYFGLKEVIVGDQKFNTAAEGQSATYERGWGKHIAAIRVEEPPASNEVEYEGFSLTLFGSVMSSSEIFAVTNELRPGNFGIYGGVEDVVGHTRKVVKINPLAGFLITDIVE